LYEARKTPKPKSSRLSAVVLSSTTTQEMISKINHRAQFFGWSRNQSDDVFEFLRFDGYDLPQGIG